jgi:hypothetical protein
MILLATRPSQAWTAVGHGEFVARRGSAGLRIVYMQGSDGCAFDWFLPSAVCEPYK